MEKQYPQIYKQGDYPQRLGTNKSLVTIAQSGCFVSSFAMKACFYGHQINPVQLNDLLVQSQIFVQENLLPDYALARIYSDINYIKTLDYEPIPTDLNTIKNFLDNPNTTITIRINLGNGNLHFVEAIACDGHSLHIANPLTGRIEDFTQRYGDPIKANLHVLVYTGPVKQALPVPPPVPPASQPTDGVAQRFNQAIAKSGNFDKVCQYLGVTNDQAIQPGSGADLVIKRFELLQEELDNIHKVQPVALPTAPVTPAPVAPETPVVDTSVDTTPKPVDTTPTPPIAFQDGTAPVASNAAAAVPTTSVGTKPFTIASGTVTPMEFLRAVFTLLFK